MEMPVFLIAHAQIEWYGYKVILCLVGNCIVLYLVI